MIYLFLIIVLLVGYIVYESVASRKEREKLQLKLMSKDVSEYKESVSPEVKSAEAVEENDDYDDLENVSTDDLLKAEDKT